MASRTLTNLKGPAGTPGTIPTEEAVAHALDGPIVGAAFVAKLAALLDADLPPLVALQVIGQLEDSATVQDLIAAAAAGLNFAQVGQFVLDPASDKTLSSFPNSTRIMSQGVQKLVGVNPAGYPASTDLNGKTSTVGGKPITVLGDPAGGVGFATTAGSGRMLPTGTTNPVLMVTDVGKAFGTSRLVLGPTANTGQMQGIGPILGLSVSGSTIHYLRVILSTTTRVYLVQRVDSTTGFAGLTGTTLITTTTVGAENDVVDLTLTAAGVLTLTVNGAQIGTYTLTAPQLATYGSSDSTKAGVWANPTLASSAGKSCNEWSWREEVFLTEARRNVTAGPDNALPQVVRDRLPDSVFDIRDYGARVDGIYLRDAVATAGAATVTSASRPFTSADVGKTIAVMGAGPVIENANDGVWISTIASVNSGVATLASNATASGAGLRCIFGTPDDAAFAKAQAAAVAAGSGTVYFPAARTIATTPLNVQNYVNWRGAGRERSIVHVIADRPGSPTAAGTADWLTCAGRNASSPLIGAHFFDFGIEAEAMIHTDGGYGSAVKPLNIYYVQRCSIQRMLMRNTPATSIPFDHSFDQCLIAHNYILNPGRLAPSGIGPGGSGIGAGARGVGVTDPTLIFDNTIVGTHSSTVAGAGQNGIFVEAQTGADPDLGTNGYKIVNNTIIAMPYGISETGATGTLIDGNTIIGCARGIRISKTTLSGSYPGLHTTVVNNTVRGSTGPGATDGVGISVFTGTAESVATREYLHTIIANNQVTESKSWGVTVTAGAIASIVGVMIHGNQIRANGRSGIRLGSSSPSKLRFLSIKDNQIVGNGRGLVSGDQAPILIAPGTTMEGGRIQDNDLYDLASSPTQGAQIVAIGATLTDVKVKDNTNDVLVTA